jgi:hypothetical protein
MLIPEPKEWGGGVQPVHVLLALEAGSVGVILFLWRIAKGLKRTNDIMEKFLIEHEMLIIDYCERKGIKVGSLLTRLQGLQK